MIGLKYKNRFSALALFGGGTIGNLRQTEIENAKLSPVYFCCGQQDRALMFARGAYNRLKNFGYKTHLRTVPNLAHDVPDDGETMAYKWITKRWSANIARRIKDDADSAFNEQKYFLAFELYHLCLSEIKNAKKNATKVDAQYLKKYNNEVDKSIKKILKNLESKEPKAFRGIKDAYDFIKAKKNFKAVKKLRKVAKDYPNKSCAKYAKVISTNIVQSDESVADKIAGKKPKSLLSHAEKYLKKNYVLRKDKTKAAKIFNLIINKYPHTSYARKASNFLEGLNK